MTPHPLDRVVWHALTTRQSALSQGDALARRYDPAVAPFAATRDDGPDALAALRDLLHPDGRAALVTVAPLGDLPAFRVLVRDTILQMVLTCAIPPAPSPPILPLGPVDVPAMQALAEATKPGPFGPRTIEMGDYRGIKDEGRLVAMAGERMRLDGFTEVSAVCVDPAQRGRGLAAALIAAVAQPIRARGETAFLHVFAANAPAIALYEKLGFETRQRFHLTVVTPAPAPG